MQSAKADRDPDDDPAEIWRIAPAIRALAAKPARAWPFVVGSYCLTCGEFVYITQISPLKNEKSPP